MIDVGDGRALCYLYRPGQLRCVLAGEKESAFLTEQGYPDLRVEAAVDLLCARLAQGGAFPKVFMMNGTKDIRELAPLFCRFRKCTSVYKRLFACGRTLDQLAVAA